MPASIGENLTSLWQGMGLAVVVLAIAKRPAALLDAWPVTIPTIEGRFPSERTVEIVDDFRNLLALGTESVFGLVWAKDERLGTVLRDVPGSLGILGSALVGYCFGESKRSWDAGNSRLR